MAMVQVSWRGEVIGLNICRDEAAAKVLQARWGGGPVIIERIFEMPSPTGHRARVDLANKVLRMMGEPLQLDPNMPGDVLSAALRELSPDALPLPEPVPHEPVTRGGLVYEARVVSPEVEAEDERMRAAQALIDELSARDVRTLTGAEKQALQNAKASLAPVVPTDEDQREQDPDELAERDPRTLTGRQKALLGGRTTFGKPRSRNALTPDGRDPRTLTGPEKLALGRQHKQRAKLAPPPAVSTGLTEQEAHELSMLRGGQPGFEGAPPLEGLEGDALIAGQRFELALRRKWSPRAAGRR